MSIEVRNLIKKFDDRVVINDDEKRFLEPPKSDELYKAITYHKE